MNESCYPPLKRLFSLFTGAESRIESYLDALQRHGIDPKDCEAAVTYLEAQWEKTSVPPVGVVIQRAQQARRLRAYEAGELEAEKRPPPLTDREKQALRLHAAILERGLSFCWLRHRWVERADRLDPNASEDYQRIYDGCRDYPTLEQIETKAAEMGIAVGNST